MTDGIPDRIWLQVHGDALPNERNEPVNIHAGDVSWCWKPIFDGDVEYIRAYLAAKREQSAPYSMLKADLRNALERERELAKALKAILGWRETDLPEGDRAAKAIEHMEGIARSALAKQGENDE